VAGIPVCAISGGRCLEHRCPLARGHGAIGSCLDGWLRWGDTEPPGLSPAAKARLNLYLRVRDLPVPAELRIAGPAG